MLKNTTFNLPDELVARAKAYAAAHGATLTSLIREHLEAITAGDAPEAVASDVLLEFSRGRIPKGEAIKALGLRDYADLLIALGEADLPLPKLPAHEIENQAATFARIWRQS
jgi:plasmid stability protein